MKNLIERKDQNRGKMGIKQHDNEEQSRGFFLLKIGTCDLVQRKVSE